ncbi:putative tetratricopeptide-like helical domain superfamily [Helianthus annuus]|uniref:Tetratricopeptide-like helical domain superfamily n=1 Tax=Helianthus annuus TaxID=4232 RepID=A0A9K3N9M4_HELAN|nr:putative tetratricopeptide-like helical domain superfamily [Helianthus annuus]KAJ0527080.1 putative tetratricopeptide-like helical domain superfamily [Helianthus annuus]KAJ0535695.1 putative tetratricopeptide-like helical domain superfamily [Helianthus annuus]KAJ0543479.1 putative tetratricopeptide-like helical domain superfamily [Helianthus annuus]KAJ0629319.1 putative tetratricopeptide-like helical domain superfamily [Helianthus annuus]
MCIKYAELEHSLGEIDRARKIYVYASCLADPHCDLWTDWHEFEVQHGNEDILETCFVLREVLMQDIARHA